MPAIERLLARHCMRIVDCRCDTPAVAAMVQSRQRYYCYTKAITAHRQLEHMINHNATCALTKAGLSAESPEWLARQAPIAWWLNGLLRSRSHGCRLTSRESRDQRGAVGWVVGCGANCLLAGWFAAGRTALKLDQSVFPATISAFHDWIINIYSSLHIFYGYA